MLPPCAPSLCSQPSASYDVLSDTAEKIANMEAETLPPAQPPANVAKRQRLVLAESPCAAGDLPQPTPPSSRSIIDELLSSDDDDQPSEKLSQHRDCNGMKPQQPVQESQLEAEADAYKNLGMKPNIPNPYTVECNAISSVPLLLEPEASEVKVLGAKSCEATDVLKENSFQVGDNTFVCVSDQLW